TVDPVARRAEPILAEVPPPSPPRRETMLANGGARAEPARPEPARGRGDITGLGGGSTTPPPPPPPRRADAPPPSPAGQGNTQRGGWLSDLLTRASQDGEPPARETSTREPQMREPPPDASRAERQTIESLDSIAVDIARMIDHEAAAELWER